MRQVLPRPQTDSVASGAGGSQHARTGGPSWTALWAEISTGGPGMSIDDKRRIVARYSDTCFAPPSPELKQSWDAELERARGRKSAAAGALGLQRKPRRIGFDDG